MDFIKKNINMILSIFILAQPIIDLITGISIHIWNINITFGIIVRVLFLAFIMIVTPFVFHQKKALIFYLLFGCYSIFYLLGLFLYQKNVFLFQELQGLVKTFYFPILLISFYYLKDSIRISKMVLFSTLLMYLFFIFVPSLFHIGYQSYEITKAGTLGFFHSANEISGIISLMTPIMFLLFYDKKFFFISVVVAIMYIVVILTIGTKTPLLTLLITIGFTILYFWIDCMKKKRYKVVALSFSLLIILSIGFSFLLPKTNFYKNIQTHLDYLKIQNITEVFEDQKLIDHFIFSQRFSFFYKEKKLYQQAPFYQQLFGIGYFHQKKATKLVEIDYFDIYFHHGLVGFILFFGVFSFVIMNVLKQNGKHHYERYMLLLSFAFILFLSFFTGHIITAPSVSLIACIIILSLAKRKKKSLLFAGVNMEIGGIENSQVNLLNNIDTKKYEVTCMLEEAKGPLLKKIKPDVLIKELKVSNHSNVFIRKIINCMRKFFFTLFYYHCYDFSCCYTTYSFSSNKIAQVASSNNAFYVHSDYRYVYPSKEKFREFFDQRHIKEYRHILFVSNESAASFRKIYPSLEGKIKVINNFIPIEEIKKKSLEPISLTKPKETLFVFVGRLDDSSKKLKRAIYLVQNILNTKLWIVGTGKDEKMYKDLVAREKLEKKVYFLGKQMNPYPYMKMADYILLTSDYEGFPVIYLEAILLEKRIITTIDVSDEFFQMGKDYADIISKDEKKMVEEVKEILKEKPRSKKIDFEKIQKQKRKQFENLFDEVV